MQISHLRDLIHKHIDHLAIFQLDIDLNEYNDQVDKIKIILKPNITIMFKGIGDIIEEIQQYTMDDGYGDMTQCSMTWTSYEELPNDDQGESITLTFNIDS